MRTAAFIPPIMATLLAAILPSAAHAQTDAAPQGSTVPGGPPDGAPPPSIFAGDNATLGLGIAYRASYDGSDDYVVTPAPLLRGTLSGFDIEARGPGLSVDLLRDAPRATTRLLAGPQFRVNLNRTSQIKDPVVRLLGERDPAIEVGGFVGVSLGGLTNAFDSLTLRVDALTDAGNVHNGTLITPSLAFATPFSPALFAVVSVSATHADGNYLRSEFGVTPAGSLASGLPSFTPADGGWKDAGATLLLGYDLSGDARDGGLGLFALTSYARLMGDAAQSPIVRLRGDRDQWFLAGGISYTF